MLRYVLVLAAGAALSCGGMSKEQARGEVRQLMTLYQEARPKFVVQKQELVQASSCSRATALRGAADDLAREAATSPDNSDTIMKVQMELQQAEKDCLAK